MENVPEAVKFLNQFTKQIITFSPISRLNNGVVCIVVIFVV